MTNFEDYKRIAIEELNECIEDMECQPILFVGSGLSKRYFGAPNWDELLGELTHLNPLSKEYAYYKQTFRNNIDIGSKLSESFSEWAWSSGRDQFSPELFTADHAPSIFMKSKISEMLNAITPKTVDTVPDQYKKEIELMQQIRPHAIITTNYDTFLETVFPEYTSIVGQKILRSQYTSIGEIFKIHGCVSEPSSLIINRHDYDEFLSKKKYLSAKLLAYFLEHPIVILGYNPNDPNIQAILSDIDEILSTNNELVPNIYIVNWKEGINGAEHFPSETLIKLESERSIRIKSLTAENFEWIYESLINENAIENVNPKLLRALLSRTYKLVRTDIPKRVIEIDYETLESALEGNEDIGKIFGVTTLSNPGAFNVSYPYTLTDVAIKLGYDNWFYANKLLKQIEDTHGASIKCSDNRYHIAIKTGANSVSRKYSQDFVELLEKQKNGEPIEVHL